MDRPQAAVARHARRQMAVARTVLQDPQQGQCRCFGGHLRVNGHHAQKASQAIRPGDVLTFPQAKQVRIVKILALSERRGPAPEAQMLYEDLTPAQPSDDGAPRPVHGRPDRRDRRAARSAKQAPLE